LIDRLNLPDLAERALATARRRNLTIVTAESCTAGKLSALLSEAPGAAEHLHGSFVAYTKANKVKALGVDAGLLKAKGAVCREVAVAMAEGALHRSPADVPWPSPASQAPIRTRTVIPLDWFALPWLAMDVSLCPSNENTARSGARRCRSTRWLTRLPN
jgi:nicotinamide-nucleotide amidase